MDHVRLGRSGLTCSVIGLGGGSSGRFGLAKGGTRSDAVKLIRTALDEGITFFDGAGICGGVDELLVEGLSGDRQRVILSTKVHLGPMPASFAGARFAHRVSAWAARRQGFVCSGTSLRRQVEQTLKALRTDCVDILNLHAVTLRQYPAAAEQVLPELSRMKEEGKLRAIGVTERFLADPNHAMMELALADPSVDTVMVGFNPANTSAAERVLPAASKADVGTIGMYALRGLLGKTGAENISRIANDAGIASLSELAYRFCRHQPGMDVVLTGTGNPDHLRQNIAAAHAPPLPSDVLERLRSL